MSRIMSASPGSKKRILVVDDELDYLHVIKLMLEGTGQYHVRTINYATSVPGVARDFKPDLILLDCMMPAADGGEIAGKLQADPDLKGTPFLFLTCTVSDVESTPSKCYEGVQTYVPKTIEFEKLVEVIEQKLRDAAAARTEPESAPETPASGSVV
jgi:CheY-like chemotaxis protein